MAVAPQGPVWFVIGRLEVGGAQRQVAALASALIAQGDQAAVFAVRAGGPFEERLRAQGVAVWTASGPRLLRVLRLARELTTRARREHPAVIHSYLASQNILVALLRPALPQSTRIVWGVRVSLVLRSSYGAVGRAAYRLQHLVRHVPDAVIANSRVGANALISAGYRSDRVHVIPNGVDAREFHPDPEARTRQRQAWGWSGEHVAIGIVARLDPVKDHHLFLASAARLTADPRLRFACVGGGPDDYRAELERAAERLRLDDVLLWAGEVIDMREVYCALDVVCLTSVHEALPNVLIEAMACGTPCVTVDVGDAREIVESTGVVALERSASAVADACRTLLERIRTEPDLHARVVAEARERYGEKQLIDRTLALLATLPHRGDAGR